MSGLFVFLSFLMIFQLTLTPLLNTFTDNCIAWYALSLSLGKGKSSHSEQREARFATRRVVYLH